MQLASQDRSKSLKHHWEETDPSSTSIAEIQVRALSICGAIMCNCSSKVEMTYQKVSQQLILTILKGRNLDWCQQYSQLYVVVCLLDGLVVDRCVGNINLLKDLLTRMFCRLQIKHSIRNLSE